VDELRSVLGMLGLPTDLRMVQAMLDIADKDGDGMLDYDEFVEFISVSEPACAPRWCLHVFVPFLPTRRMKSSTRKHLLCSACI